MKKIIVLAAFCTAGLMSAKSTAAQGSAEKKSEVKKETGRSAAAYACVPVTYSCGIKGWACGKTVMEMLENAWSGDSFFCD
ncbi:hypothetical protein [Chryseobacterium flavum]|uniref:hypothetical protein n=1 Tax=Chryseobacterium flavum TaxID=415851 RepID=UPI0028A5A25D|nr:hypothetical protein [Chryseobacterium flavum]